MGAAALIVIGVYMLLDNFASLFLAYLPDFISRSVFVFFRALPQLAFAIIIILIGIRLVTGKKEALKNESAEKESI